MKTFIADYIREISEADPYRDVRIRRHLVPTGATGEEYIYCAVTLPVDAGGGISPPTVVICPPFLEERILSQRLLVRFQKYLSLHGYLAIRFDYRGTGDSSGDFSQVTFASMKHDLDRVLAFARTEFDPGRTCLLGARLGGTLILESDAQRTGAHAAVLWSPVISASEYLHELYKLQIVSEGSFRLQADFAPPDFAALSGSGAPFEILGYRLHPDFVDECRRPARIPVECRYHRLEIFRLGLREPRKYSEQVERLVHDLQASPCTVYSRYVKCPPFWSDGLSYWEEVGNLFEETLSCLGHE